MLVHRSERVLQTLRVYPNKKMSDKSMHDLNTKKSYDNRSKSRSSVRRFSNDKPKLKTSKMSRGTFRKDNVLLVENVRRLNKKEGKLIRINPKDRSEETNLNRARKILPLSRNKINR